jgi:branched-chain amino acid transport system ATP-binding protein
MVVKFAGKTTTFTACTGVVKPTAGAVKLFGEEITNLLRVASGPLKPTAGQLTIDGEDVTGASPHKPVEKSVCHVPEGRGVFPSLAVKDNLLLQSVKGSEDEAVEKAVATFPRLGERLSQLAGTMSGGEQ